MEKMVFLILVLLQPAEPTVEIHVAIEMPSELRCEQMKREAYTYGSYIDIRERGTYRTKLPIDGVYCETRRVNP
jgi:hypothetical protein